MAEETYVWATMDTDGTITLFENEDDVHWRDDLKTWEKDARELDDNRTGALERYRLVNPAQIQQYGFTPMKVKVRVYKPNPGISRHEAVELVMELKAEAASMEPPAYCGDYERLEALRRNMRSTLNRMYLGEDIEGE